MEILSQLLMICAPLLVVVVGMLLLVQRFFQRDKELRLIELKMAESKETRLLKLQAYERMALFLERISPESVISRVIEPDMISHELQLAIVKGIKSEFSHNLSQQIYISSTAWNMIVAAKDEIIKAVGMIAQQVPHEATGTQLARVILESIAKSGHTLPTQTALDYLKNEAQELL